ncbi:MAG: rhodanese-like domain-containing protein [Flavobacteriales bacterium]|nr:rhodanese-like domain-containing protein [Flavobacteriales bacterium]
MRLLTVLFLTTLLLLPRLARAQESRLDARSFKARLAEKDVQLVDVRTPAEFAKGHIAGAVNNDWLEDGFLERAKTLDKSKPILLYCAAGGRSEEAMNALKGVGYTDVVDLEVGFNGWKQNNLPVSVK